MSTTTIAATSGVSRRYSSTRLLLEKLERNRSRNLELLSGAGCPRQLAVIRCERCGISEPAQFWTPTWLRGRALHLRCPSGCETRIRYDLRANRVVRDRDWLDFRPRAPQLTVLAIVLAASLLVGFAGNLKAPPNEEVIGAAVDTNNRSVPPVPASTSGGDVNSGNTSRLVDAGGDGSATDGRSTRLASAGPGDRATGARTPQAADR